MKVLVTGASGFLGRHIAERLAPHFKIRVLDINPLEGFTDFVQGSVADPDTVRRAVEGVDALVISHMAPNRPEIYGSPEIPFDVNVKGTALLFHQAVACGIRRIVLISSIAVVAKHTQAGTRLTRDLSHTPNAMYALTKTLQETTAQYYHSTHGLEIAILRPAYIVREDSLMDKYGIQRPTVNWQFIDPRDIADAAAAALRIPNLSYEVFYTVAGPDADIYVDMAHTRDFLGWKPNHTFSQYPRDS